MSLRTETNHWSIEDSDTVYIALLRMLAEQLLTYTDTKYGLLQFADYFVKSSGPQIVHCLAGMPLSREKHAISFPKLFGIIRQQRLNTHPSECIHYRIDISRVVFYDCNIHYEKMIVLFL